MCRIKALMDKGEHYDVQSSGLTKDGIIMGGHYDVDMKSWMQKGSLCASKGGWTREDITMCEFKGRMDKGGGHNDGRAL